MFNEHLLCVGPCMGAGTGGLAMNRAVKVPFQMKRMF